MEAVQSFFSSTCCTHFIFLMRFAFRSKPLKERINCRWHTSLNLIKQLNKRCYVHIFRFEQINALLKEIDWHPIFDRIFSTACRTPSIDYFQHDSIDRLLSTESHRSTNFTEYHRWIEQYRLEFQQKSNLSCFCNWLVDFVSSTT